MPYHAATSKPTVSRCCSTSSSLCEHEGKVLRQVDSDCSFALENDTQVDEVGDWVVELTVSDQDGNTDTDTVAITVAP